MVPTASRYSRLWCHNRAQYDIPRGRRPQILPRRSRGRTQSSLPLMPHSPGGSADLGHMFGEQLSRRGRHRTTLQSFFSSRLLLVSGRTRGPHFSRGSSAASWFCHNRRSARACRSRLSRISASLNKCTDPNTTYRRRVRMHRKARNMSRKGKRPESSDHSAHTCGHESARQALQRTRRVRHSPMKSRQAQSVLQHESCA
jgi:hypothetical protein